jgi:CheY-like chemotaxis protein
MEGISMHEFRKKLLCIDDDPTGLVLRKTFLESVGYDVRIAGSGREGVKLVASHPFDAVILDYDMPETNGGTVAIAIKRIRHRLPIIMLSGAIAVPEKMLQSIDGFIAKGQSPVSLLRMIQQLLLA